MRAYSKKSAERGVTLVELMVVVAIVGVLAAIAVSVSVVHFLDDAKTAEAKQTVGAIGRSAAAAFERETLVSEVISEGKTSLVKSHVLCANSTAVPSSMALLKGKKYQPDSAPGQDFETGDTLTGWKCLKFTLNSPTYYQYYYIKGKSSLANGQASSTANGFEAAAQGDLNGNDVYSHFAITGEVNTSTGELRLATQVFVENEFE